MIAGIAALLPGALVLQLVVQRRLYRQRSGGGEICWVTTDDGARIALHRHRPARATPGREPVLMISGFGLNQAALDFDERYSWAKRFAEAGFDAWILELRRSGLSGSAGRRDGSFDDYVRDARAAIARVLGETGAAKLHWVGYSLGGMLLYAALGTGGAAQIRSGVAIESPLGLFGYPLSRGSLTLLGLLERTPFLNDIPYRALTHVLLPWMRLLYGSPLFTTWMNLDNTDRRLVRKILYLVIDDVPVALALQFREWIVAEGLRSNGGETDYLEGLSEARVPVLLMAGRAGEFSKRARPALERLRGETRWIEFTRQNGFSADYGHSDLIFGLRAPEEVFPHALEWVARHQPSDDGSLAIK